MILSVRPAHPFRCCEHFLVAGRGMITSLPSNYTLRFLLSGRVGVNAAAHAWGRTLQLGQHSRLHASVLTAATLTQMALCVQPTEPAS